MKKIAVLIESLFDERELIYPYIRLQEAGYEVHLVGTEADTIYRSKAGLTEKSTHAARDISADTYAAVIIPGGYSPDYMRRSPATREFVTALFNAGKPIAAICHGPWMMASCCDLRGRKVTSVAAIRDDLINAGANYLDQEVVVDGNLITSRTPADLPAFMQAVLQAVK